MPNAEKVDKVTELKRRIASSQALLLADFKGLTVTDAMELRRSLGEANAGFSIVKNTLMKRAADESGIEQIDDLLDGPTAVAFVEGDAVLAAKRLVEAAKRFPDLILKGGYMDGRVLPAADAQRLATLESREAMLSKVAGLAKGEMSRAAGMFQGLQARFLSLLEAYRDEKPPPAESEQPTVVPDEPQASGAPVSEPATTDASGEGSGESQLPEPPAQGEEDSLSPGAPEEEVQSPSEQTQASDEIGEE